MQTRSYIASDYAGLDAGPWSFYYGYEKTDANDEWCFVASRGGDEKMRIPASKLTSRDKFDCGECLLSGLAIFLERVGITIPSEG